MRRDTRSPRRATRAFLVGIVVFAGVTLVLAVMPGDSGEAPARLLATAFAVAIVVDVLRQVRGAAATSRRAWVDVVGWAVAAWIFTPIAVAVYTARRLVGLPVISG